MRQHCWALLLWTFVLLGVCSSSAVGRPVLSGELRHLYYSDFMPTHLHDGSHTLPLVAVPYVDVSTGADIIDEESVREAPEVVLVIQDQLLLRVTVRAPQPPSNVHATPNRLLPFKIVISDAEDETDIENDDDASRRNTVVLLREVSFHSIADEENGAVHFDLPATHAGRPIHLNHFDSGKTFFIRLDTYFRRTTVFEAAILLTQSLSSFPDEALDSMVTTTLIPHNTSFSVRFLCSHTIREDGAVVSVTVLRRPPIPPLRLIVTAVEDFGDLLSALSSNPKVDLDISGPFERRLYGKRHWGIKETLLARSSSKTPPPRGFSADSFVVPSVVFHEGRAVVRVVVEFEELQRKYEEHYRLESATSIIRSLRRSGGERVLMPVSWENWRLCFTGDHEQAKIQDHHYLRVAFRNPSYQLSSSMGGGVDRADDAPSHEEPQPSLNLLLLQPFPVRNLQVHVVDGHNDTIFLEEAYDVPYINFHHGIDPLTQLPFGWHHGIDGNLRFVGGGDVLQVFVFFDLRDELEAQDIALAESSIGYRSSVECPTALTSPSRYEPWLYRWATSLTSGDHLHHAYRPIAEAHRNVDTLLEWLERNGGFIHDDVTISRQPPLKYRLTHLTADGGTEVAVLLRRLVYRSPSWTESSPVQSAPSTLLLSIPWTMLLRADSAYGVPHLRHALAAVLGDSDDRANAMAEWSEPSIHNTSVERLLPEAYWSDRLGQLVRIALFVLTQAEDPATGVSYHVWARSIFGAKWNPTRSTDESSVPLHPGLPLHTLDHPSAWADLLRLHGLAHFAEVVERQRRMIDDVYDALDDAFSWLQLSNRAFAHVVAVLQAVALESPPPSHERRATVFVAPFLNLCEHDEEPSVALRFDPHLGALVMQSHSHSASAAQDYCERLLTVHSASEDAASCSRLLTCDRAQAFDHKHQLMRRMTSLESLLRRGDACRLCLGVVDIEVIPPAVTNVKRRVFLLRWADTKEERAAIRFRLHEFVERVVCHPSAEPGLGPDGTAGCVTQHLKELLARRRRDIPQVPLRARVIHDALPDPLRPFAGSMSQQIAFLLIKAHKVLEQHENDL